MQLNSFNHFRALAIIFIVTGHSFHTVGLKFDGVIEGTISNLIHGGTSLFVFISGFLFHHVFFGRYKYRKFIKNKAKNVLLPYIFLSFLPILYYVFLRTESLAEFFQPKGSGWINEVLIPIVKLYSTGGFFAAYWYIPFIMITFLLSPLHFKYIALSVRYQLIIIATFSVVSMLIHRPVDNISVLQSILYFTPVYFIGITSSICKSQIYTALRNKEVYILCAVIALAAIQAQLGHIGNYHKPALEFGGIDLMFLQKLLLCFFFMIWLDRFESFTNSYINTVAATSFTIFFLHPFIIRVSGHVHMEQWAINPWLLLTVFVILTVITCVAIALLTKKASPQYSRYLTGY